MLDDSMETDQNATDDNAIEEEIDQNATDSNPTEEKHVDQDTESWVSGLCSDLNSKDLEAEQCCNAEGYGEMAPESVKTIARLLNLSALAPTESFFDLGSGTGRLVMHMVVMGYARLATGVELNSARHAFAVELAGSGAVPEDILWMSGTVEMSGSGGGGSHLTAGVQLLQGNMLAADISSATVIYMNPACLSCETRMALLQKIMDECFALTHVLTTIPLPELVASGYFVEQTTEMLSPMIGYEWRVPVMLYQRA